MSVRSSVGQGPSTVAVAALVGALSVALLAACAAPSGSSQPPSRSPSPSASEQPTAPGSELPTPAPSGFAFSAEAVLDYYRGQGFACGDRQPSSSASGHTYQGCQVVTPAGLTLVVGLTTDANGDLADGFASVRAAAGELLIEPADALDHLSGFLGAMLGDERGLALLPWLAGHLGDEYAATTSVDLVVATYRPAEDDFTQLFVEIANQDYLDAPTPSPS